MHPAPSVIAFTTLSGLGLGLLIFLGLGLPVVTGWTAFGFYFIGFGLAIAGLASSAFHLGRPERALKAFTQWRTSWLSREAWLSGFALSVMGLYAALEIFFSLWIAPLGWLGSLLCIATIIATSMIYAQLKTVPRWSRPTTPLLYLVTALAGGALLAGQVSIAIPFLIAAGALQIWVFLDGDRTMAAPASTMESATQLGRIGSVRAFEPPHTGPNYLTKEMMFRVGRKHAVQLRVIAVLLMAVLPVLLLLVGSGHVVAGIAVLSHIIGVAAARWLFFAEAEHIVGLYYGAT